MTTRPASVARLSMTRLSMTRLPVAGLPVTGLRDRLWWRRASRSVVLDHRSAQSRVLAALVADSPEVAAVRSTATVSAGEVVFEAMVAGHHLRGTGAPATVADLARAVAGPRPVRLVGVLPYGPLRALRFASGDDSLTLLCGRLVVSADAGPGPLRPPSAGPTALGCGSARSGSSL
jgi:hypothetical protein